MKSPYTGKEMSLLKEEREITFRKESFPVIYHYYFCSQTKEQFVSTRLDEINMCQVYNQYRDKHNLPFPDEIKEIREKYGLSATKMSAVLGFGVNSYRNYENGEVPSQSNGNLIQMADDPEKFYDLVELSTDLKAKDKEKLLKKIEKMITSEAFSQWGIENYLIGNQLPGELNGYRKPSLERLTEMVVFFSEKLQPWKTQLNKLLFYSDFLMFKENCYSISGVQYRAITRGPVPNNFQSLFEYMMNQDHVDVWYTEFPNGVEGEQFKTHPGRNFRPELFSESELEVLRKVAEKFKGIKTQEIVKISHKEKAWKLNEAKKEIINYKLAFDLKEI